ncbi:phosphodiester glycosidase family protein [Bacteroidota bacterium]
MIFFMLVHLLSILFISTRLLAYDTTLVRKIGPGCIHYNITIDSLPVELKIIEMDLTIPTNKLEIAIANDRFNLGGERTSNLVNRKLSLGKFIIGAVNGDFFGGNPRQAENSMIINGEYIKGVKLNRSMFAITENNIPHIGDFQFEGRVIVGVDTLLVDALNYQSGEEQVLLFNKYFPPEFIRDSSYNVFKISPLDSILINEQNEFKIIEKNIALNDSDLSNKDFILLIKETVDVNLSQKFNDGINIKVYLGTKNPVKNLYSLIGGLPRLVTNGTRPESFVGIERLTSKRFIDINPRTAIGFNFDKTKLYLVAVDGRQAGYSIGMSLYDLADFLISFGCYNALNLDGGGSTTLTVRDEVVNKPSDKTGEREVYNSVLLISADTKENLIGSINIIPDTVDLNSVNTTIPDFIIHDKWGFNFRISTEYINWQFTNSLLLVDKLFKIVPNKSESWFITGSYDAFEDTIWIKNSRAGIK